MLEVHLLEIVALLAIAFVGGWLWGRNYERSRFERRMRWELRNYPSPRVDVEYDGPLDALPDFLADELAKKEKGEPN